MKERNMNSYMEKAMEAFHEESKGETLEEVAREKINRFAASALEGAQAYANEIMALVSEAPRNDWPLIAFVMEDIAAGLEERLHQSEKFVKDLLCRNSERRMISGIEEGEE